jgi:hypothetical protein
MSCIIDSGRSGFSCNTNAGGLKAMYILASFDKDLKANSTIANGELTATSSSNDVYKFELEADENTFTEENEVSRSAGTSVFTSNGTLQFVKQGPVSQALFQKLSKMRVQLILEDFNGGFRLVGLENGVDFQVGTTSGGAISDLSGYNVTFTGRELDLAPYVSSSLIGAGSEFDLQTAVVDPNA